jgi:hypothetical protein
MSEPLKGTSKNCPFRPCESGVSQSSQYFLRCGSSEILDFSRCPKVDQAENANT